MNKGQIILTLALTLCAASAAWAQGDEPSCYIQQGGVGVWTVRVGRHHPRSLPMASGRVAG